MLYSGVCLSSNFPYLRREAYLGPTDQPWHQRQMEVDVGVVPKEGRNLTSWEMPVYNSNQCEWQRYK